MPSSKLERIKGQGAFDLFGLGNDDIFFEDIAEEPEEIWTEIDRAEQIAEAYRQRNKKIGYRIFNNEGRVTD